MRDAVSDSSPLIHLAKIEVLRKGVTRSWRVISSIFPFPKTLVLTCLATAGKSDGLPALGGTIVSKQQKSSD
jgi:hypothetical protein